MSKHSIYLCSNCLSDLIESKKQPKCKFCDSIMVKKEELVEEWIEKHSSTFALLFSHVSKLYQHTKMIDEETADFDKEKYELEDEVYEILNSIVDKIEIRLPEAVILHTTGFYMQEFDWDDFEFNPPIDLLDHSIRVGFLFFLDFLSLAITHSILRNTKHDNTAASLSELLWAHKYFNHILREEAGGREEMKGPKARWPVLIYGLFENYIPPIYAINNVWKEAEKFK